MDKVATYGIAIRDDRNGMMEITSLPFNYHAIVEFVRLKEGTHTVQIAPAPAGRNLFITGGMASYWATVGDANAGDKYEPDEHYNGTLSPARNKYLFDFKNGGQPTKQHYISDYSINNNGQITITVSLSPTTIGSALINDRYAVLEVWAGVLT